MTFSNPYGTLQDAIAIDIGTIEGCSPAKCADIASLKTHVLAVSPGCLIQRRDDGAWIFVPKQWAGRERKKNLLTIWPDRNPLGLRIMQGPPGMPSEEEGFSSAKLAEYRTRMDQLLIKWR